MNAAKMPTSSMFDCPNNSNPNCKLNCEVLHEESAFEIRWSVVESGETIVFQLVGKIDEGNYMAFGLSGEDDRSVMVGGDAMIGWFDQTTGRGNVVDYHLGSKSVCQGDSGSCPDVRLKDGSNNIRLLSAAKVNGFTILTFQRKLKALDQWDKQIRTNESQPIIWAIGSMQNELAGYHSIRSKDDFSIDFGRASKWNCPAPEPEPELSESSPSPSAILSTSSSHSLQNSVVDPSKEDVNTVSPSLKEDSHLAASNNHKTSYLNPQAWKIPPIPCHEPEDRVFYAQIGPSGRKEVFKSITGKDEQPENVWYINGLLLPEISLVRNKNYSFVIQGGDNPFYITNDPTGDYEHKLDSERKNSYVYAGVNFDLQGNYNPTAMGKLCRWIESGNHPAEFFTSYAAYQRSLTLDCKKGHSGVLQFTPDDNTPNLVYYQSYSRRDLGWKIRIVNECGNNDNPHNALSPSSLDKPLSAVPTVPSLQSLQSDQNVGESINRESLLSLTLPNEGRNQPNLHLRDMPHAGSSSVHPVDNTFIIDTSAGGGGKVTFPNVLPIDNTRLVFNGNPPESVTQGPNRQIVAMPQGSTFQFSQNPPPAVYQIAIDPNGVSDNRVPSQSVYAPAGFQVPLQAGDAHILRRTGSPQLPLSSNPYKFQTKYGERPEVIYESKPEYYIGNNRQPLMSHPNLRYDSVPNSHGGQQILYPTTLSPQRHNGPLAYISHDKNNDYQELSMRMQGGPGPIVRVQTIPRRSPMEMQNSDNVNVKYIEYPHAAIQILQNDGRSNPPHAWAHSRNLPKRDHARQVQSIPSQNKNPLQRATRRDSRNDDDLYENSKRDNSQIFPSSSPLEAVNSLNKKGAGEGVTINLKTSQEDKKSLLSSSSGGVLANETKVSQSEMLVAETISNAEQLSKEDEEEGCKVNGPDSRGCAASVPSENLKEDKNTDRELVQRSQEPLLHPVVTEPLLESFGPVFRPSPPDTKPFNISKEFGQQIYHPSYTLLSEDPKRNPEYEPLSISEPRLRAASSIPYIRRSPSKNHPPIIRNEYRHPDFNKYLRIPSPHRLSPQRPISHSSSTFHEIIKLLVPGTRSNTLNKFDTNGRWKEHQDHHHHHQPLRRFPHPLLQSRSDRVRLSQTEKTREQNGSQINNNMAQINKGEHIAEEEENHDESSSGTAASESTSTAHDGNEAKDGQDNLSLTLLTDVWQIINQQGISNPSSSSQYQPSTIQQQQKPTNGNPGRQIPPKPIMIKRNQGNPAVNPNLNSPYRYQREPFYSREIGLNGENKNVHEAERERREIRRVPPPLSLLTSSAAAKATFPTERLKEKSLPEKWGNV